MPKELWDLFIDRYIQQLPYRTIRVILHAFCYFERDDLETSDMIMKG